MAATDDIAALMALRQSARLRYKTSASSWQEFGDADVIALGDAGTAVSLTPGVNRQSAPTWVNISSSGPRIKYFVRQAINHEIQQYLGRPDLHAQYTALDTSGNFTTIITTAQTNCVVA